MATDTAYDVLHTCYFCEVETSGEGMVPVTEDGDMAHPDCLADAAEAAAERKAEDRRDAREARGW